MHIMYKCLPMANIMTRRDIHVNILEYLSRWYFLKKCYTVILLWKLSKIIALYYDITLYPCFLDMPWYTVILPWYYRENTTAWKRSYKSGQKGLLDVFQMFSNFQQFVIMPLQEKSVSFKQKINPVTHTLEWPVTKYTYTQKTDW